MPEEHILRTLALKYGSDKWGPHSYCDHYETHFAKFRQKAINILEIGIGGYDDPKSGGASLRMWSEYFPQARIFGLDFFEKRLQLPDTVAVYRGSQADGDLLRRISDDAGGLDVVIDDGSHINEHVIASFQILFPLLNSGGIYVIEDTQTSYWPRLGGSSQEPDSTQTMMGFFKNLVHGLNHAEIIGRLDQPNVFDRDIISIAFYHNMIFVEKGDNSELSNVAPDDALRQP